MTRESIQKAVSTKCDVLIPDDNKKRNQVRGKMFKDISKLDSVYEDKNQFDEAIGVMISAYLNKVEQSQQSSIIGKEMEQAAARSSGGKVSQSGGNDVIWRAIPRKELDPLKTLMGKQSDFDLMKSFKDFKEELWYQQYVALSPTPIDVYDEKFLTLVGGGSKFQD